MSPIPLKLDFLCKQVQRYSEHKIKYLIHCLRFDSPEKNKTKLTAQNKTLVIPVMPQFA